LPSILHPIKIIETPRDAMQGIKTLIPTARKIEYINALLKVGYDTIDAGSFVSPEKIPQMADTVEVLNGIDFSSSSSKLLAIVPNVRGAEMAIELPQIYYVGYPFSISETFQLRNTNATIAESLDRVKVIQDLCLKNDRELVVYISMGFGNPYGDPYNTDIVEHWVSEVAKIDVKIISLSDTVGVASADTISYLFKVLINDFPEIEFGSHLHTAPHNWLEKVEAAFHSGCRRYDGAMKGLGGCPMAKDDLIGNMPTENLVSYFSKDQLGSGFDMDAFAAALRKAGEIFPH
jgi:hydroxymethylglutaryl-CoA lyase